jgi:hypothetical protein
VRPVSGAAGVMGREFWGAVAARAIAETLTGA